MNAGRIATALLVIGVPLASCGPTSSSSRQLAIAAISRFSHARAVTVSLDHRGDPSYGPFVVTLTQRPCRTLQTEHGDCDSLPSCTPLIFGLVPTTLLPVPNADVPREDDGNQPAVPQGAVEFDQGGTGWAGWGPDDWMIVIDTAGDPIQSATTCGSHCDFYVYTMSNYFP